MGEEEFARLYSSSSRSLFHRGGANCVLRQITSPSSAETPSRLLNRFEVAETPQSDTAPTSSSPGRSHAVVGRATDQEILEWPLSFFRANVNRGRAGNAVRRRPHSLPSGSVGARDTAVRNDSSLG